jgi:deoxycytidylate deaminase
MNANIKAVAPAAAPQAKSGQSAKNASDDLKSRKSEELLIALSGPVGCGIPSVRESLTKVLEKRGYQVVHVKVSSTFEALASNLHLEIKDDAESDNHEFVRIWRSQSIGNALRLKLGDDMGAQLAIKAISVDRTAKHSGVPIPEIKPGKIAYLIDQLKHPREVALLRSIYDNMFYLVGVLSGFNQRKNELSSKMPEDLAVRLMHRDRAETHSAKGVSDNAGQQLEKTLKLADFFISNSQRSMGLLKGPIERFVGLIHGDTGLTPTTKECGMFAAYSAALKSACLSRQVGAAIVDRHGNIISTGCNDVPRAGGGLYDVSNGKNDFRCINKAGLCFNDKYKDELRDQIESVLRKAGINEASLLKTEIKDSVSAIAEKVKKNTRIKDLIEFSRAVHAEMDAIIQSARKGNPSIQGSFLFTTTYPCHSCARHIVAAGIRAVYFIEPYEKSLAIELHEDAIDHDPASGDADWSSDKPFKKVAFLHFEGVAPMRFTSLFNALDGRKDESGRMVENPGGTNMKRSTEYLDDYKVLEARVLERLENLSSPAIEDQPTPDQPIVA